MRKGFDDSGTALLDQGISTELNRSAQHRLWRRLREDNDTLARNELICLYLPLARTVAKVYYGRRFHDEIEFEEYLQLASLGMIEAVDRFDIYAGVSFKTFAAKSIHGSIVDGIARSTEKQEQIAWKVRLRRERLEEAKAHAVSPKAASPDVPEQIQTATVLQHLAEVGIGLALGWLLDETRMLVSGDDAEDRHHIPYFNSLELLQLRERVSALVNGLPTQQKTVLQCHYIQEMPFAQIAEALKLTRGRISQIHKQGIDNLRLRLTDVRKCDVVL